jgi:hypothetical protein
VHHLIPSYCPPSRWVRKESQAWLDLALDEAMILGFDYDQILLANYRNRKNGAKFAASRSKMT